jgi:hypothetical protein
MRVIRLEPAPAIMIQGSYPGACSPLGRSRQLGPDPLHAAPIAGMKSSRVDRSFAGSLSCESLIAVGENTGVRWLRVPPSDLQEFTVFHGGAIGGVRRYSIAIVLGSQSVRNDCRDREVFRGIDGSGGLLGTSRNGPSRDRRLIAGVPTSVDTAFFMDFRLWERMFQCDFESSGAA